MGKKKFRACYQEFRLRFDELDLFKLLFVFYDNKTGRKSYYLARWRGAQAPFSNGLKSATFHPLFRHEKINFQRGWDKIVHLFIKGGMSAILTSYHTSQYRLAARDTHTIFRPNTLKTRLFVHVLFQPAAAGGKFLFVRSRQRPEIGYFAPDIHARQDAFWMSSGKKDLLLG